MTPKLEVCLYPTAGHGGLGYAIGSHGIKLPVSLKLVNGLIEINHDDDPIIQCRFLSWTEDTHLDSENRWVNNMKGKRLESFPYEPEDVPPDL